ncbi:MAG: hypothetical protein KIT09_15435 [Bryobacteraceae bacterium]|nr:hypothetical protein [Bryobacteraceae bacterium]
MRGWRKFATVSLLTVLGVEGLDFALKTAPLPRPASRFVQYYEALGRTKSLDGWQRFLLSCALAGQR